jgi:hypothetical protein
MRLCAGRDGRKRNSVRFGVIEDEWPQVPGALVHRIAVGQ